MHHTPCPKYLSGVRDLAFLPRLIGTRRQWKELQVASVAESLSVTLVRFYALIKNPQLLQVEQQEWDKGLLNTDSRSNRTSLRG